MNTRCVHLSPRLMAALSLLQDCRVVADVGCDHGRLAAALLQQHVCERVIATDVSADSLEKARALLSYIGLSERVSIRLGDGLKVLQEGECDAICLLGMGGTLMCDILSAVDCPLMGARLAVFQPMRAQADIRRYLHQNSYHVLDDRIVTEHGRLYQVFSAQKCHAIQPLPQGFPPDFYDVGFVSFSQRDPLLPALIGAQLRQHRLRLQTAAHTKGEAVLLQKVSALEAIRSAFLKGEPI